MVNITPELKKHVQENIHIEQVHFDATGNHYFNAYEVNGKKVSRAPSDVEEVKSNYDITDTMSRDEILAEKEPVSEPIITKEPIANEHANDHENKDLIPDPSATV